MITEAEHKRNQEYAAKLRILTAHDHYGVTCYENIGYCNIIISRVMHAIDINEKMQIICKEYNLSQDDAIGILIDMSDIFEKPLPLLNTFPDMVTYVAYLLSEIEGCKRGVMATWAKPLAEKIVSIIHSNALQPT